MTQLILWMIMAYGLTNILVYGSIFNTPRTFIMKWAAEEYAPFNGVAVFLADMLSCMMCCSVWVGFFFGIFVYSPLHELIGMPAWASWFFDGMLASGAVWAINSVVEWFEENRPSKQ